MKTIKYYFLILFLLLLGCESEYAPSLTTEQAVYESLFLEIQGDAISSYYLVEQTEASWFKSNPLEEFEWRGLLQDKKDVPFSVVRSLYSRNQKSEKLNWIPVITNAQLLPSKYVDLNSENRDELCLVPGEEPHIGVGRDDRFYRPYYTVSRVGFSNDGTFSIVKLSKKCAPMSGAGEFFILLKLEDNSWKYLGERTLWIS
ncbi:hypothetical protein ACUR5C_09680 [Aliikangiella sp. IMCC44653]